MKGIFLIMGASLIWAVDTLIRYPLLRAGISAERIVFTEHLLLTMCFIPVLYKGREKIWQAKISEAFYFLIIGGLGSAIATLAFTKAFTFINPSLVILLQKLQPIVAITLAWVFLKEPIHKKFLWWAALCLVGGIMISHKDVFPGLSKMDFSYSFLNKKSLVGYGLTIVAIVGWGAATVFGKKLSLNGFKAKEIMGGRFFFGFLTLLPFVYYTEVVFDFVPETWGKIALMVVLSGLLGMYLYYRGLKLIPARLCALAEMFFPFCAVAVNWIFLDARLDPVQLGGGVLLLLGSTVIQLKHY